MDYKEEAHLLAAQIMQDGWSWTQDGNTLLRIIDLLDLHIQTKAARIAAVQKLVREMDDTYGWDAPNMSEATEDYFSDWMVETRIKS